MKLAWLPLCVLGAPLLAQDTVFPGFETSQVPLPVDGQVRTLSDGRFITFDGQIMDLWDVDGTFLLNLGQLPFVGETGAMVVSPGESFVVFGEVITGNLYRVEIDGSGVQTLGNLKRNRSAEFEDAQNVLISAGTGTGGPGGEIWRLHVPSKTLSLLAVIGGAPGPLTIDSDGNAIYARVAATAPPPAGSTNILRFKAEDLVPIANPGYQMEDDILVLQMESVDPVGDWVEESSVPGYTGESYFRWAGPDYFDTPGNGTLTWEFNVPTSGDYQFRFYNLHDDPDTTQENDCWVKMDGGPWEKIFSGYDAPGWNWETFVDPDFGDPYNAIYTLAPGSHTIQISGRSNDFRLDRWHLYKVGKPGALNLALEQSFFEVGLSESDADVIASGFDGASDVEIDTEVDTIFVAERNANTGANAIHAFGKAFGVSPVLVDAGTDGSFEGLDFVREQNPGFYFPYQPSNNGDLYYTRRDTTSGALERRLLETKRPELAISGPGTSGVGPVTLTLTGGPPLGNAFLIFTLPGSVLPTENQVYFDGLPFVHTPFPLAQLQILFFPLPLNGNGATALSFSNSFGTNILAFQMVLMTGAFEVVGSSTTVVL